MYKIKLLLLFGFNDDDDDDDNDDNFLLCCTLTFKNGLIFKSSSNDEAHVVVL